MRLLTLAIVGLAAATPALAGNPAAALPQSIWRASADGGLTHLQSGLACPESLAGFRRTEAQLFDGAGFDVGCNYAASGVALTVYITRRNGSTPADSMAQARAEYLQAGAGRHPSLIADGVANDGGLAWTTALYSEDNDLRSGIWIADIQGWTVLYRVTYRPAAEALASAGVAGMSASVQASAGVQLNRCARSPAPVRRGARVTDAKAIGEAAMMTSLLGGALMSAAADEDKTGEGKEKEKIEVREISWCAEAMMQSGPYRMVYWRSVFDDGADAESDKITLVSSGPPPTLNLAADGLAALLSEKKGPPQWSATVSAGSRIAIYGYFKDRPSPDLVSALFVDILSGKAKPVGGYAVDGNTITISVPPE